MPEFLRTYVKVTLANIERYEQQAAEYERLVEIALRPFAEKIELMCTMFAVTPRLAWRIGWRGDWSGWRQPGAGARDGEDPRRG